MRRVRIGCATLLFTTRTTYTTAVACCAHYHLTRSTTFCQIHTAVFFIPLPVPSSRRAAPRRTAGPESSPRSVWMTKGDFDASIRELVPAKWIPEEDKQRLSQVRKKKKKQQNTLSCLYFGVDVVDKSRPGGQPVYDVCLGRFHRPMRMYVWMYAAVSPTVLCTRRSHPGFCLA